MKKSILNVGLTKHLKNLKSANENQFRKFLILIFLLISATCSSQIISTDVLNTLLYPSGTSLHKGIVFPVQYYNDVVNYTIPLTGGVYTTATVDFDTTYVTFPCDIVKHSSTFKFTSKDLGIITVTPGSFCAGSTTDTIYFEIKASYNGGAEIDTRVFKIPLNRLPVKTVLVMDISGSMGELTTGTGGETRWSVLKNSLGIFTTLYEFFRQNNSDSLGLTYFTTNTIQPDPPIKDGFTVVTAYTDSPTTLDLINTDMTGRGPLNTTAMGKGLFNAKIKLKKDSAHKFRKIAVLFTDGLQNVAPFVSVTDGNTLTDGTVLNDPGSKIDSIRYYTIASWLPGDTPPVLSMIAKASHAESKHTTSTLSSDSEVEDFFTAQLESILHGESPQIVGTAVGKVNHSQVIHTINLNNNISRAAFVFTYSKGDTIEVAVEKDGIQFPVIQLPGNNYKIIGLEFPLAGNNTGTSGQYKVKVSGITNKTYKLTCIADDHYFDYNVKLNKALYTVGDTINFTTSITLGGVPLASPTDTVKVALFKPGDDVGNLLATTSATLPGGVVDQGTPAQQKFETLFSSDSTFRNALLPIEQRIVLDNQGNGVFKGKFTNTQVTGVYKMLFYVNSKSDASGTIEREKMFTSVFQFGEVKPEAPTVVSNTTAPSVPDTIAKPAPGKKDRFNPLVLQIRPKNRFGYYMGPGYTSRLGVRINPGKTVKTNLQKSSMFSVSAPPAGELAVKYIYDNLDGRYFIYIYGVQKGMNPKVEIKIGDELLYSGKCFSIPVWFYLLIIILLILMILIRYFKPKNAKVYQALLWIFTILCLLILILHYLGFLGFLY